MTRTAVGASPQATGGPQFAAREIGGIWFTASVPVDIDQFTNDSGSLSAGVAVLVARPDAVARFVQNMSVSPLTLQLGDAGPSYVLSAAPTEGAPGGVFPPPGLSIVYTGKLNLSSLDATAPFVSGWA